MFWVKLMVVAICDASSMGPLGIIQGKKLRPRGQLGDRAGFERH